MHTICLIVDEKGLCFPRMYLWVVGVVGYGNVGWWDIQLIIMKFIILPGNGWTNILKSNWYGKLATEPKSRGLEVEIEIQSSVEEFKIYQPAISSKLKEKYPTALQIFGFELRSIINFSIKFFLVGLFFIYGSSSWNGVVVIKCIGVLFCLLAGYMWVYVRSKVFSY